MRLELRHGGAFLILSSALLAASCGYGVREERLPESGATLEGTVAYGGEKVQAALIIVAGERARRPATSTRPPAGTGSKTPPSAR
jgi:hypothetical protein